MAGQIQQLERARAFAFPLPYGVELVGRRVIVKPGTFKVTKVSIA